MVEHPLPRRVLIGEPVEEALPRLLEDLGVRRVLIVSDRIVSSLSKTIRLVRRLEEAGFTVGVYSRVPSEPAVDVADRIAEAAGSLRAEVIVAIGGGSVIDAAKAGLVRYLAPHVKIEDIAPFNRLGVERSKALLVAAPTTSGTGSDASHGIVVTVYKDGVREKVAVGSPEVVPYATILDPDYPLEAPPRLRGAVGMDALSHALEALVASQATPLTDALAVGAARILFRHLPGAVGGDRESAEMVHVAATMAGMAFTGAGLGLAHALAHPLGARLGTHHGLTVGIILPAVLRLYERVEGTGEKLAVLKRVLEAVDGLPESSTLAGHVERLQEEIGFPRTFREAGVDEGLYMEAARQAAEEALHDPDIAFSPIVPSPGEMYELLVGLYGG